MTDVLENLSNLYTAPHTYTASPRTDPLELSPCWPRWSLYLDFPPPDAFLWSFVGFTTIQSPSINWNMILPSHPFLCISHNRSRNGKFLLQLITLSRKVSVLLPARLIISRQTFPTCLQGRVQWGICGWEKFKSRSILSNVDTIIDCIYCINISRSCNAPLFPTILLPRCR